MSSSNENKSLFTEVLPKRGEVYEVDNPSLVLCKPKIMPLKSVTLEKMERMQENIIKAVKVPEKPSSGPGKQ